MRTVSRIGSPPTISYRPKSHVSPRGRSQANPNHNATAQAEHERPGGGLSADLAQRVHTMFGPQLNGVAKPEAGKHRGEFIEAAGIDNAAEDGSLAWLVGQFDTRPLMLDLELGPRACPGTPACLGKSLAHAVGQHAIAVVVLLDQIICKPRPGRPTRRDLHLAYPVSASPEHRQHPAPNDMAEHS